MLTGVPLSDRKTRMAFRIWEEQKDNVFINGDSAKGWDGFINVANVASPNAAATFASSTGLVIADIINAALSDVSDGTNQVRYADTLVLPVEQYNLIATKPIGDNADKSVLQYIMDHNVYTSQFGNPLMIRTLRQLKGAGGTNVDRMVGVQPGYGRASLPRAAGIAVPGAAAQGGHLDLLRAWRAGRAGSYGAGRVPLPRQYLGQTGGLD